MNKRKNDGNFWTRELKVSPASVLVGASLRIFIPVLGLFLLGLAFDFLRQTTAQIAIFGAVLGAVVAIYLMYLQFEDLAGQPHATPKILKSFFDHGAKAEKSEKMRVDKIKGSVKAEEPAKDVAEKPEKIAGTKFEESAEATAQEPEKNVKSDAELEKSAGKTASAKSEKIRAKASSRAKNEKSEEKTAKDHKNENREKR